MNAKELAAKLDGGEYGNEITKALEAEAKTAGLVVVFGASDDLMEFRGAIHDELDAYGGRIAYVNQTGLLENDCDNDNCPYFGKLKQSAATIEAVWNRDGFSWVFDTTIPHETFVILEDGEDRYCRGIVFALADVTQSPA